MKKTKVQFILNDEDIRPVAASVITAILTRFGAKYRDAVQKLNDAISFGDGDQIEQSFEAMNNIFEEQRDEVYNAHNLFKEVKIIKVVDQKVSDNGLAEAPSEEKSPEGNKIISRVDLGDHGAKQNRDGSWDKLG